MNRIKALYRGWSIPCAGTQVYAPRYREEWLQKIEHAGVRRRAELLYQQLDGLQALRRTLRPELLTESRKHNASKLLRQIPCIGPIRAARLIALMQTPHRFRSKRQLWTYSGLGIETRDSAQYRFVRGQLQRAKKPQQIRGLNRNHNHEMKEIFKGAATRASCGVGTASLSLFRHRLLVLWWHSVRRRSQKRRISWTRMLNLAMRWLPAPQVLHPYPDARFAATHPR